MSGRKREAGDSLYKVYLDGPTSVGVNLVADRLYLHPEVIIEDAVKEYLNNRDLSKLSKREGKRSAKIQKRRRTDS